jgi:hypothetical protein
VVIIFKMFCHTANADIITERFSRAVVAPEATASILHRCCKSVVWELGLKSCDRGGEWCGSLKELASGHMLLVADSRRESVPFPSH